MRKARIAIIGTGWWATTAHLPALRARPDAEIVAICDQRNDVLDKAASKYGIAKTYSDYRQLLENETLDGAIVSVWNAAHYEVTRACLQRKLHVLVEKPMCLTLSDADSMIRERDAAGVQLMVGYMRRYAPAFLQAEIGRAHV